MRFICTDIINKYEFKNNITKTLLSNEDTYMEDTTEFEKVSLHYDKTNNITQTNYINPLAKKLLTTKDYQANKTISELATVYGVTIQTNIPNISTIPFNFNFNQLTDMHSPFWYTIIRDDGIVYLARPYPLTTTELFSINEENILTKDINYMNIGFEGATGKDYTVWKPPCEKNNVEPYGSYTSVLNGLMFNKYMSQNCVVAFNSNQEIEPLDKIQYQCEDENVDLLIINKEVKQDIYTYTAIKQSTIVF